jgi:dolichyl-phosphate-mannose-protein mannosyltransferase
MRRYATTILPIVLFLGVILFLQWKSGAFGAEFGRHPDEAAHYVNGLLVRDYIATGLPENPVAFAQRYYVHYPKVSIGHWPPGFYLLEAAWMLLFGPGRLSLLMLLALLSTATAAIFYTLLGRYTSKLLALAGTILFLSLYHVQSSYTHLFAEAIHLLLILSAALLFAKFLAQPSSRNSVLFGVVACAAILTKGSGLLLALLPPLAVLLSGRLHLYRRLVFWYPAVMVAVICGPWYYFTVGQSASGWDHQSSFWAYAVAAIVFNLEALRWSTGWFMLPVVVAGLILVLQRLRRQPGVDPVLASLTALFTSTLIFHTVVPAGLENRYLIPAMLVWVVFVSVGIDWLAAHLPDKPFSPKARQAILALLALGYFFQSVFLVPPRIHYGFDEVAERLVTDPDLAEDVALVTSRHMGEGMLISEVAMRDSERPSRYILRATKLIAQAKWSGVGYELLLASPAEVMAAIESIGIRLLVIDLEPGRSYEHQDLLQQTVKAFPARWRLLEHVRGEPDLPGIEVYRYRGQSLRPFDTDRLAEFMELPGRSSNFAPVLESAGQELP